MECKRNPLTFCYDIYKDSTVCKDKYFFMLYFFIFVCLLYKLLCQGVLVLMKYINNRSTTNT